MKKSTVEEDEEEEEEEGGIDIAAARQRMLEEDKIDKQIYRERIKQKHRVWISYARTVLVLIIIHDIGSAREDKTDLRTEEINEFTNW